MTKDRIARLSRLVALRRQLKQRRHAEYEDAQHTLARAVEVEERHATACDGLDREHDKLVDTELDPADLELIRLARVAAKRKLSLASVESERASQAVVERRDALLTAHRAHRALELFFEKVETNHRYEQARRERAQLDEAALGAFLSQRGLT